MSKSLSATALCGRIRCRTDKSRLPARRHASRRIFWLSQVDDDEEVYRMPANFVPVNFPIISAIFLVSACATPYQLSENGLGFRARLDRASALEVVATHVVEDSTQKGVCASITYATGVPDPARFVALNGTILTFEGAKLKYEGTRRTELGDHEESRGVYSRQKANFDIDLTQLKGIEAGNSEPALTYSCHGFDNGYSVKLTSEDATSVIIQVNADRDEQLLAALSYLSPNAKLSSRR